MWAHRKLYVKQWEHQKPEERYTVEVRKGGIPVAGYPSDSISNVEQEVMYWRKANHIHAWFVRNVQDNSDDCGTYFVDIEVIQDLRDTCQAVIGASKLIDGMVNNGTVYNKENPNGLTLRVPGRVIEDATVAKKELPVEQGCFFGNQEYDEDYLIEIRRTFDWATKAIADNDEGDELGDIYYHSSW